MKVVAVSVGREFDTEKLEEVFPGKVFVRWEEPIVVDVHGIETHIYAFGSVVFFGYEEAIVRAFVERMQQIAEGSEEMFWEEYMWEPEIKARGRSVRIGDSEIYVTDEGVYGPLDEQAKKILSFVLAQSASLRRIEKRADELLESVELLLEELGKRTLMFSLRETRKSLLDALRTRNSLLTDLLILEKPPITWEDVGYEILFERLSYIFEIEDRYNRLTKKLDYVLETAQIASELVTDARFLLLEFLIVLFFLVELITLFVE